MTAIFAMWNRHGFSLAGDSNQTAKLSDQLWIDPVEKIMSFKHHQIAIASAGDGLINDVEVNELFRKWEKTLTSQLPTLEEYVSNFLIWYYKQQFDHYVSSNYRDTLDGAFKYFKKLLEDGNIDYQNLDYKKIVDFLVADFSTYINEYINVFNNHFADYEVNNFDGSRVDDFMTSYSLNQSYKIIDKVVKSLDLEKDFHERCLVIKNQNLDLLTELFTDNFGCKFDPESEWQNALIDTEIYFQQVYVAEKVSKASILIIGYGEDDWIPKAAKIDLQATIWHGIKRAALVSFSSPDHEWFVDLAVNTATRSFIRGYSENLLMNISENHKAFIKKGKDEEFIEHIREFGSSRFAQVLQKMEVLTVDRLEYLARLFVQLEALQSYLHQPLPGVGGDVNVITMTKTTRKEKKYPELPV